MLYQTKIAGYNDMLDSVKKYASQITPEQVGYGLGGAAGGAALGYLASHLLDRKASTKRRLLYALIGAAGGAGISEYALSRMRRAPAVVPEEIEDEEDAVAAEALGAIGSPWTSGAAIGGGIAGGTAGAGYGAWKAFKRSNPNATFKDFSKRFYTSGLTNAKNIGKGAWAGIKGAGKGTWEGTKRFGRWLKNEPEIVVSKTEDNVPQATLQQQRSRWARAKDYGKGKWAAAKTKGKETWGKAKDYAKAVGHKYKTPAIYGVGGALLGYGAGVGADYLGRRYGTPR